MKTSIRIIRDTIDGNRILKDVMGVAEYHRIQCSTGFRAAAQHCLGVLQQAGVTASVHSYDYDDKKWYWTSKSFMEWDCKGGYCDLVYPTNKRIADFATNNISVMQKSWPCDYRNKPLDIVMLDKGSDEAQYEGLDLKGKLIFVHEAFNPFVEWAIGKRGALGIITDFMREVPGNRERYDMTDIINYTSFWWKDCANEPKAFGYVLSPRAGDSLTQVCREVAAQHKLDASKPAYPQATCFMDSKLYPGHIEAVEAIIPGETDEEILLIAHLCHPRCSANDNGSGVAAAIEVMRIIKQLVDAGKIPSLKRGLRLCLIPEFSGTFAYLNEYENVLHKWKAGINLDMVGGRQSKDYGPITISALPHGAPSFVTDVAALVLDEIKKEFISHNKDNYVSLFNSVVGEFTAGSDHYILSDPTVGIPTPMLGQWPDLNYHTSGDILEELDPYILHKSASIAAGYAYTLANLAVSDLPIIFNKSLQRFVEDATKISNDGLESNETTTSVFQKIEHYKNYYLGSCADIVRFFPQNTVSKQIADMQKDINAQSDMIFNAFLRAKGDKNFTYTPAKGDAKYDYVPVRTCKGPILHLDDYSYGDDILTTEYKNYTSKNQAKVHSAHSFEAIVGYYADGKRTVNEIAHLAMLESRNGDVEMVHEYIQLLVKFGVIVIK